MYSIFTAIGIGAVLGLIIGFSWAAFGLWEPLVMGITWGVISMIASFIIISRRIAKKIEPRFAVIQQQVQGGQTAIALQALEDLFPLAKWQVLLKGQIQAQIGSIHYASRNESKAVEYLTQAGPRLADAQMVLASIHFRRAQLEKAKDVLEMSIKMNKKQALLYNFLAFILVKEKKNDEAIEVLNRCLKASKDSKATKENLSKIQNGKKMNMKPFGMPWYSLQIERPPASVQQQLAQQMQAQPGMQMSGYQQRKMRRIR